jgi:hypothetical protein
MQMDPSLRPDQAETFTAILKEMGDAAKSPETIQEISAAVKKLEAGNLNCLICIWFYCQRKSLFAIN